jgi:ubiquinone/menaquinone biosynthesis C-methylase UbiE
MTELNATGERLVTNHFDSESKTEHLHRYAMACNYIKDKIVLDIASGEGYGSNLLAQNAKSVFGVDISEEAVKHAQEKYTSPNLKYLKGNTSEIPLGDHTVDVIISFETLEHHDQHTRMMLECKRVLKENGLLIISSPDKKYYTDLPGYHNPFHVKELYEDEFKKLISDHFKYTTFLNQNYFRASIILPAEGTEKFESFEGSFEKVSSKGVFIPLYNIALATDGELPVTTGSFFEDHIPPAFSEQDIVQKYINTTTWKIGQAIVNPLLKIKHFFRFEKP